MTYEEAVQFLTENKDDIQARLKAGGTLSSYLIDDYRACKKDPFCVKSLESLVFHIGIYKELVASGN